MLHLQLCVKQQNSSFTTASSVTNRVPMSISEREGSSKNGIAIALYIANSRRGSFLGFGVLGFVGLSLGVEG